MYLTAFAPRFFGYQKCSPARHFTPPYKHTVLQHFQLFKILCIIFCVREYVNFGVVCCFCIFCLLSLFLCLRVVSCDSFVNFHKAPSGFFWRYILNEVFTYGTARYMQVICTYLLFCDLFTLKLAADEASNW